MSIPVSHQDVDEARAQVAAGVHPFVVALLEPLKERQRVRDHGRSLDLALDPLLDEPDHAGVLVEVAEARIFGHHGQLGGGVEHVGNIEQRGDQQRAVGLRGADFVLEEIADPGNPRVLVEQPLARVLVDRTERPGVSVGAREVEVRGLRSAAAAIWRTSSDE